MVEKVAVERKEAIMRDCRSDVGAIVCRRLVAVGPVGMYVGWLHVKCLHTSRSVSGVIVETEGREAECVH